MLYDGRNQEHQYTRYRATRAANQKNMLSNVLLPLVYLGSLLPPRSLKQIIQSHTRKLTIILSKFHRAYQACRNKPGRDNKLLRGIYCSSPLVGFIIFKFKDYRNNCSRTGYCTNYNYTTVSLAYAAVNFSPLEQNTL